VTDGGVGDAGDSEPAGRIFLDDGDTVDVPHGGAFTIESNGWVTVEREGVATHYPPNRVDRVEIFLDRDVPRER
jgi:hypothetical protein